MKKRILSGILALTMCFSMTPSIAWGSGMTEFSDGGASGESEKKEEFTDELEIEEEKEQSVAAAGVPEVENGFSDGENVCGLVDNGTAAENINQGIKHTVHIQNVAPFLIEEQPIVDIINNHDGTVTIGVDPDVCIGNQKDTGKYKVMYYQAAIHVGGTSGMNPESKNGDQMYLYGQYSPVPVDRKIRITAKYINIALCTGSSTPGYYYKAAVQENINNPTKVSYDLDGGTDGPQVDWVWEKDYQWGNNHEKTPKKTGYRFDGWYTEKNGQGMRINSVQDIFISASGTEISEITLHAKWVHAHSWNYSLSGGTLKAYCSNTTLQCHYYGTSSNHAKVTVSLKLEGFDNNKCAEHGSNYSVTCDNTFPPEIGATIGSIIYAGRDGTTSSESETLPTSPGKYKAKVNITLPGEQYSGEIYTDFEIKKENATNSDSKVNITGWIYGKNSNTPSIDQSLNPENQTVQYTYYTDGACTTQISTENGAETEGGVPKNAGTYYVKAQIPESANYNAGTATGTFEIKPLPAQLDWSSSDLIYNGQPQTVTAEVRNALPGDTFTLVYEADETYTNTGKSAGTYRAKLTDLGNANYSLSEEESVYSWEIKKAPVTLTVVLDEFTYGEQPVIKLQGAPSDSKVVYQYKVKDKDDSTYAGITEEGLKKLSAGEYTLKAVVEETENYKGFSATCDFKIKKASTTNSDSKVSISGWTYGGYNEAENTPSIDPSLNPENQTVQYTYYTDEACTTQTSIENGAEAAGGVPKNAGTYYVKAQIPESANYNAGTATGTFEIKPKELTVKPDDLHKHIGGEEPQLTYTTGGIVEGETLSGITLQRVSGEDARKYEITATETAGANPNYTVTRETGTFTIEDHNWPKDGKILSPATLLSEGMQERTCTAPGCGQKRYDAIPKQDGKPADPYADKIDKYIQILGSEITVAALDNEEIILFEVFPQSEKEKISYQGQKAKVWLE